MEHVLVSYKNLKGHAPWISAGFLTQCVEIIWLPYQLWYVNMWILTQNYDSSKKHPGRLIHYQIWSILTPFVTYKNTFYGFDLGSIVKVWVVLGFRLNFYMWKCGFWPKISISGYLSQVDLTVIKNDQFWRKPPKNGPFPKFFNSRASN